MDLTIARSFKGKQIMIENATYTDNYKENSKDTRKLCVVAEKMQQKEKQ